MCPVCFANAAVIAAGAIPAGGLSLFAVKKFFSKNLAKSLNKRNRRRTK
jgi:hypothetical protein